MEERSTGHFGSAEGVDEDGYLTPRPSGAVSVAQNQPIWSLMYGVFEIESHPSEKFGPSLLGHGIGCPGRANQPLQLAHIVKTQK